MSPRRVVLRPDRGRGVRALPAAALRLERGRLRRHPDAHRRGPRALPRGARALAAGVPLHPRRRVPGHEPRAVPAAAAARRGAPERIRGRGSRSVSRRRHTGDDGERRDAPIEDVSEGDEVLSCRGSGAFGPARVAACTESRRRAGIAITTASGRRLVSTPEHMHFAGFKVGLSPQLHMTYLMWKRGTGFRVGTSRTYTDARAGTLPGPSLRMNQEHADATWVVSTHPTDADARAAEAVALPEISESRRSRSSQDRAGIAGRKPGRRTRS